MSDPVSLKALDSFHSAPTGMVHARATFETHRAHADALIGRGLAAESKAAPAHQDKKAPEPTNKAAPAGKTK